jgi:integrase/recombinase XerD
MSGRELLRIETSPRYTDKDLDRKLSLALETITTDFYRSLLTDKTKMSRENALTLAEYLIAMKSEINPSPSYIRNNLQFLSELTRFVGIKKKFEDLTKEDIISFLDNHRKPEDEDPLHQWIGSYNIKCSAILRFYKWVCYRHTEDPKKRNELSRLEKKPECTRGIRELKRREISCLKPSDIWNQDDDKLFLKWVANKRDRCYHTVARDLSARPHEILGLKIKSIIFKRTDRYEYAEVLVNGKTGSRSIPLIQSIPYVKEWLSEHPSRNNPNSYLFVGLSKRSMGKPLTVGGLYQMYSYYKKKFFPKLLCDPNVTSEDKEKIRALLIKPFFPYIRRHSALTEKSKQLHLPTLTQHAGWSMNSKMPQKYIHYFGNESTESLLEAYGIITKNNIPITFLNPKICSQCGESNTQDARFCNKCKMVLSLEGYQEALEEQKKRELDIEKLNDVYEQKIELMREEMEKKFQQILTKIDTSRLA